MTKWHSKKDTGRGLKAKRVQRAMNEGTGTVRMRRILQETSRKKRSVEEHNARIDAQIAEEMKKFLEEIGLDEKLQEI